MLKKMSVGLNQGHLRSTQPLPPSSYSCLDTHICWKEPCNNKRHIPAVVVSIMQIQYSLAASPPPSKLHHNPGASSPLAHPTKLHHNLGASSPLAHPTKLHHNPGASSPLAHPTKLHHNPGASSPLAHTPKLQQPPSDQNDSLTTHAIIFIDSINLLQNIKSGMQSPDGICHCLPSTFQNSCGYAALDIQ